jgi:hypothetical protein
MAPNHFFDYRVLVKARTAFRREFIWQIVRGDGPDEKAVSESIRAFTSMEEAYTSGAAALERMIQGRFATPDGAPEAEARER